MSTPSDDPIQRLAELATDIERHRTAIWLAERERDEIRAELRRANALADRSSKQGAPRAAAP